MMVSKKMLRNNRSTISYNIKIMENETNIPGVKILQQYIKNLQFNSSENIAIIKLEESFVPKVSTNLMVDATKVQEGKYEVNIKLETIAKKDSEQLFSINLEYAGLFQLENIESEDLELLLLVYCPSIIFPFARKIISDTTSDAGFPALMLSLVDFSVLYKENKNN